MRRPSTVELMLLTTVVLWALNLTDADYYDSLVTFPTTGVLQRPSAPRRLGASLTYTL